jgi:maltooligosyltrehalose synthase
LITVSVNCLRARRRKRDKEVFKKHLARLCADNPPLIRFIDFRVAEINRLAGDSGELHALLKQQVYRLAYWRVAGDEINYRRFFDINDLGGLRIEDEKVFDATHQLILSLIEQGKTQGLRIDHADGLYDPVAYYQRLNKKIAAILNADPGQEAPPIYIVAEKIVVNYEYLSSNWPIHGTTGYEFANIINGVLIDSTAEKPLTHCYVRFIGHRQDFDEIPHFWQEAVSHWRRLNKSQKPKMGRAVIARNDEYLFYQVLIGTWPLTHLNNSELTDYQERIQSYMIKAVREAKQYTSWLNPNEGYEQAVSEFVRRCLDVNVSSHFLQDFTVFERQIRKPGLYNALAQTVLHLTSPGVPDIFQGNEFLKINIHGTGADQLLAFARKDQNNFAIIVVPRLMTHLLYNEPDKSLDDVWADTWLELPQKAPRHYQELFNQGRGSAEPIEDYLQLYVRDTLKLFPLVILSGIVK